MEISSASLRIFFPVCGNILHYEVEGEKMDFDINFLFSWVFTLEKTVRFNMNKISV